MHYKKAIRFLADSQGFTLIDLLLTLSVIGILTTISYSVIASSPSNINL